jgi:Domain of Unknown Function with PDB structure (DUF3857)
VCNPDAGVQHHGLLTFPYASAIGSFDIEFIRVHKPDGSIVETSPDNIQDMPSEITRQAPFYSDPREKHVAVKGLGVGDVLEYKVHHTRKQATDSGAVLVGLYVSSRFHSLAATTRDQRTARPRNQMGIPGNNSCGQRRRQLSHLHVVRLEPRSSQLATADLRAGKSDEADATYRKLIGLTPTPEMLNRAAYEMAEAETTPPIALEFAEKSVRAAEDASMEMDLAKLRPEDSDRTLKIASYWGTLGWVQQRLGRLDDAEKTLTSSWKLTQNGVAAAHLCELYVTEHKPQAALRMCRLARNRLAMEKETILYGVAGLIKQNNQRLEKLSAGASKTWNMNTIDEINNMRDFKFPRLAVTGTATAGFSLMLEYDSQARHFKVQETKFNDGPQTLKSASSALKQLNLNFTSPDGNPVRVIQAGNVICGGPTTCELLLLDASVTH